MNKLLLRLFIHFGLLSLLVSGCASHPEARGHSEIRGYPAKRKPITLTKNKVLEAMLYLEGDPENNALDQCYSRRVACSVTRTNGDFVPRVVSEIFPVTSGDVPVTESLHMKLMSKTLPDAGLVFGELGEYYSLFRLGSAGHYDLEFIILCINKEGAVVRSGRSEKLRFYLSNKIKDTSQPMVLPVPIRMQ